MGNTFCLVKIFDRYQDCGLEGLSDRTRRPFRYRSDEVAARRRRSAGSAHHGGLLFGYDGSQNFCAFDAVTGKILWHTWLPTATTNGATTFLVDGFQYVTIAAGDTLYAYTLNRPQ